MLELASTPQPLPPALVSMLSFAHKASNPRFRCRFGAYPDFETMLHVGSKRFQRSIGMMGGAVDVASECWNVLSNPHGPSRNRSWDPHMLYAYVLCMSCMRRSCGPFARQELDSSTRYHGGEGWDSRKQGEKRHLWVSHDTQRHFPSLQSSCETRKRRLSRAIFPTHPQGMRPVSRGRGHIGAGEHRS